MRLASLVVDFVLALDKLMSAVKFADHLVNLKKDDAQDAAAKRKSLKEYGKFPENEKRLIEFTRMISISSEALKKAWHEYRQERR